MGMGDRGLPPEKFGTDSRSDVRLVVALDMRTGEVLSLGESRFLDLSESRFRNFLGDFDRREDDFLSPLSR